MIEKIIKFIEKNEFSEKFNNAILYWSLFYLEEYKLCNYQQYILFQEHINNLDIEKINKIIAKYAVDLLFRINKIKKVKFFDNEKYKQIIVSESIKNKEIKLITKLWLTSGLNLNEIMKLKWKSITIINNILLVNYRKRTRISICANYVIRDLIKLNKEKTYLFSDKRKISIKLLNKEIQKIIKKQYKKLFCSKNQNSIIKSRILDFIEYDSANQKYIKYILGKKLITNSNKINKKEFNKIMKIRSKI